MYSFSFESRPNVVKVLPKLNAAADSDPSVKKSLDMARSRFLDADFGKADEETSLTCLLDREGYVLGKYGTRGEDILIALFFTDEEEDIAVAGYESEFYEIEQLADNATEEGR